jgi:hypothetical protein
MVTSIDDCPSIADGEGSVVTARFVTREVHIVASVDVPGADGTVETITGTTIHPIWSVDRHEWVPLGELVEGEQLSSHLPSPLRGRGTEGEGAASAIVLSVTLSRVTQPVYNIEVHGEHVYQVGELGVLVHNAYPGDLGLAVAKRMRVIQGPGAPDELVNVLQKLGRNIDRNQLREVIHRIKDKMKLGATDDLVWDHSGGVWDSRTGEFLGKVWEWMN